MENKEAVNCLHYFFMLWTFHLMAFFIPFVLVIRAGWEGTWDHILYQSIKDSHFPTPLVLWSNATPQEHCCLSNSHHPGQERGWMSGYGSGLPYLPLLSTKHHPWISAALESRHLNKHRPQIHVSTAPMIWVQWYLSFRKPKTFILIFGATRSCFRGHIYRSVNSHTLYM